MISFDDAPPNYWFALIIVFGLSLGLSIGLTLIARRLAPGLGLMDKPGPRKKQPKPVARFGALPLWGAFTMTAIIAHFLIPGTDPNEAIRLTGLILGGTLIFAFGLLDDRFDLPSLPQYIVQLLAAGISIAFMIFIQRFTNPLNGELTELPYIVTVIVSLFWLGLMMNTLNWLDGVDGLAAGVALIASILLFIHTLRVSDQFLQHPLAQWSVSLLPLALIGAILGFLIFNWHPASIFMGSGAVYLGYTLGSLSIIGGAKMATILLVMGLPLLDVAWQIARRILDGKNPGIGDRGHIHFRLIDANISPRLIASGYYLVCAIFGVIALVIPTSQFKLIAILIMVALVVVGFALVARYSGPFHDDKNDQTEPRIDPHSH